MEWCCMENALANVVIALCFPITRELNIVGCRKKVTAIVASPTKRRILRRILVDTETRFFLHVQKYRMPISVANALMLLLCNMRYSIWCVCGLYKRQPMTAILSRLSFPLLSVSSLFSRVFQTTCFTK